MKNLLHFLAITIAVLFLSLYPFELQSNIIIQTGNPAICGSGVTIKMDDIPIPNPPTVKVVPPAGATAGQMMALITQALADAVAAQWAVCPECEGGAEGCDPTGATLVNADGSALTPTISMGVGDTVVATLAGGAYDLTYKCSACEGSNPFNGGNNGWQNGIDAPVFDKLDNGLEGRLKIHPSPSRDYVIVGFETESELKKVRLEITDISGITVLKKGIGTIMAGLYNQYLDVNKLPVGSYHIHLFANDLKLDSSLLMIVR